jgi:hypothetical protein
LHVEEWLNQIRGVQLCCRPIILAKATQFPNDLSAHLQRLWGSIFSNILKLSGSSVPLQRCWWVLWPAPLTWLHGCTNRLTSTITVVRRVIDRTYWRDSVSVSAVISLAAFGSMAAPAIVFAQGTTAPSAARANISAANGELLFRQRCATCHVVAAGRPQLLGPSLTRVVGRRAGTTSFAYSPTNPAQRAAIIAYLSR